MVDEGIERALYTLIREDLSERTLVVVGQRGTLNALYAHYYLELLGEGRWYLTAPIGQSEPQLDFESFRGVARDHVLQ